MIIKQKVRTWILVLLVAAPSSAGAQILESISFKNMSIGIGWNRTDYDFGYSEISDYFNNALETSFLIDVRANFNGPYDLIVSPTFELWSWTDNSGAQFDAIQNGVDDYMFSLDISKVFASNNRFSAYFGGGIGYHFLTYWTNFPRFNPYFQDGTFNQLQKIVQRTSLIAPGLTTGFEFNLWEGFYISTEIRREFRNELRQWKFLINFSMF